MGLDPISAVAGGVQSLIGLGQSIFGNKARKRAEKDFNNHVNSFQPNQSILNYYNDALKKYNTNPYDTAQFQVGNNLTQRNLGTGLNFAQDRRGALGSIGKLVQGANDASLRNVANIETQKGQDLSRLGSAALMKTNEEQKKFDMLYNLKAIKAGQTAATVNSGIKNLYGGLGTIAAGAKKKDE